MKKTSCLIQPFIILGLLFQCAYSNAQEKSKGIVLVVVGAGGTDEYAEIFQKTAKNIIESVDQNYNTIKTIGVQGSDSGFAKKQKEILLTELSTASKSNCREIWLILIGHGTFDGKHARFNLMGPDLSVEELREAIKSFKVPSIIGCCFSSSGAFLKPLSVKNQVVITATKSGQQHYFSRFGEHFSEAFADSASDLNHDQQVSILEAFIIGSKRTHDYFTEKGVIPTEDALLDDNGDGFGTPIDWFQGVRSIKTPKDKSLAPDGRYANSFFLKPSELELKLTFEQKIKRDRLESDIELLRAQKNTIDELEYYQKLEIILLELAALYNIN